MIVHDLAFILGIAILTQCFFSILFLSSFQWERNKWLVMVFAAIFLLHTGFIQNQGIELKPWQKLFFGNPGYVMLTVPAMFFYTKKLVEVSLPPTIKLLPHLLPFLIFVLYFVWIDFESPERFMLVFQEGQRRPVHLLYFFVLLAITITYGKATLNLIQKNEKKYKEEYAETNTYLTLNWLKYLHWFIISLLLLGILSMMFSFFFNQIKFPFWFLELLFLICTISLSYYSFRQPTLYRTNSDTSANNNQIENEKSSASKSLLSEEEMKQLAPKVDQYINDTQAFLNPEIKMPEIAKQLNLSPNVFSWFLNEYYQKNFFTFINEHRIKHAVKLIKDEAYDNYTLEAISQIAGFKSKTTFNNRFKEIMGVTPSVYKKRN